MIPNLKMYKFRPCLFAIFFCCVYPNKVLAQTKISLQQAIEIALSNNLQVKQSVVNESLASQDLRQSKFNILPTMYASINESENFGRTLDYTTYSYVTQKTNLANEAVTANVTLFQGFQKIRQISANKLLLEADKSATQKVKNDLRLNVILTFTSILGSQDELTAAMQQLELAKKQLEVANIGVNAGKKMSSEISLAKSQIAKAELNITTIQNQLNNAKVDLQEYMNLPVGMPIDIVGSKDNDIKYQQRSTIEIYRIASNFLPEKSQALYSRQYAEKEVSIQRGGYYPTLNLSSGVASNYSRILGTDTVFFVPQKHFFEQFKTNLTEYIQLSLSIPILNGFTVKTAVNKAKLNLENARLNEDVVKNSIYKVINQANDDLNAAYKTYNYSKEQYDATLETYNVMQKRYVSGLSNPIDVNQAQNDMNQAQFDMIQAKYNLYLKSKVIDFYLGKEVSY